MGETDTPALLSAERLAEIEQRQQRTVAIDAKDAPLTGLGRLVVYDVPDLLTHIRAQAVQIAAARSEEPPIPMREEDMPRTGNYYEHRVQCPHCDTTCMTVSGYRAHQKRQHGRAEEGTG